LYIVGGKGLLVLSCEFLFVIAHCLSIIYKDFSISIHLGEFGYFYQNNLYIKENLYSVKIVSTVSLY